MKDWTGIDGGELDQGLHIYMHHHMTHSFRFVGPHQGALYFVHHYNRVGYMKPWIVALQHASPDSRVGRRGCSWSTIRVRALLQHMEPLLSTVGQSACADAFRRAHDNLDLIMVNGTAGCCAQLGENAPFWPWSGDDRNVF